MRDYQILVDKIIKKSFPELKGKVVVKEKEMKSKARARYYLSGRIILVNPNLKKYSLRILKGMFVHELCHFYINERKGYGWFLTKLDILKCRLSKSYHEKNEKGADMLAIEKGYKKDLLISRKALKPRKPKFYLSESEIKNK